MNGYISRKIATKIEEVSQYYPVIVITGPRQSGKTSLCRHLFPDYKYVNLEDLSTRAVATADPTLFLDTNGPRIVIDEVQNVPALLSMIQIRVDEDKSRRYILTGSCNFSLLQTITQSLAGRAALFTLLPFSFQELTDGQLDCPTEQLLFQGQYPGVIANGIPPYIFFQNYYNTYVERDIRNLLRLKNILRFDTFIKLLASRAGSEFNASALAREVGVTSVTVTEWLSILTTSYIVYRLPPYFANISKRLTKMPKVYFHDTGLLCYLLGIESPGQIQAHPLRGAIFENMAVGELLKQRLNAALDPNIFFYREHSGIEVDAVVSTPGGLKLYEIKSGRTFQSEYTASMKALESAMPDVASSTVIYDGVTMAPVAVNLRNI